VPEFSSQPARDRAAPGASQPSRRQTSNNPRGAQQQLLRLQRAAGNRAVTQLMGGATTEIHRWPWSKKTSAPSSPAPVDPSVKKALEAFATRDKTSIEAAANAYAKKKKEAEDVDLGHGFTGSGKAEGAVQAGAWGSAEVAELVDAYAVLLKAGVVVGAAVKLEGELAREFGPVKAKLKGAIEGFAGAYAKAQGRLQVGKTGLVATGKAEAFAGAKSSQKAAVEFTYGELGLEGEVSAEEMAGAEAKAEGSFALSKEEIALAGEASAFAGAKAKGSAGGKAKLYGRDAFKGKISGEVSAGAGGEARGGFRIGRGVIKLNLGGNVTVGVGGGGDVDLQADMKPVAVWIWRQVDKARWNASPQEAESVLKAPDAVKAKLKKQVKKYADRKLSLLEADRADNFVKEEKVQAIIGSVLPRKLVKGRGNAGAIDTMIKAAVEEAIAESLAGVSSKPIVATVTDGKLMKIEGLPEGADLKKRGKTVSKKTGEALDAIVLSDGDD
jgi:hypothetical protein